MPDPTPAAPSTRPALALAALFGIVALLLAPPVLSRAISLDWQLGDMRVPAWIAAAACATIALALVAFRGLFGRVWARVFPTRKHLAFKLGAIAFSLALAVVMAEVAFRMIGYPFHSSWTPSEFAIARFDEEIGWSYKPNTRAVQPFGKDERDVAMRFDAIGARVPDEPPPAAEPPRKPTVVFVGGSFTMGHGVTYEESFVGRVAAALAPRYAVVNLGVQGFGTDQSWLLFERHADAFDVKAVVYTFISDHVARNDNHDRRLLFRQGRFLGTKPRFRLTDDGGLEQIHRPIRYEDYPYSRVLAAMQLSFIHRGPAPSIPLTRALIRAIDDAASRRGARFLAVHFHQARPSSARGDLVFDGLDGFPIVDTRTDAPADWPKWIIPGDDHPTPRAHARVATMITAALSRLGIR